MKLNPRQRKFVKEYTKTSNATESAKKAGYSIKVIEFIRLKKTGKEPQVITYVENFDLFKSHLEAYRYSFKDFKEEVETDYL